MGVAEVRSRGKVWYLSPGFSGQGRNFGRANQIIILDFESVVHVTPFQSVTRLTISPHKCMCPIHISV